MQIESHIIEENSVEVAEKTWIKPAVDVAIAGQMVVNTPAEVRTPSSACLRCAYNAFAEQLGCVNAFGACPYLTRQKIVFQILVKF